MMNSKDNRKKIMRTLVIATWALVLVGAYWFFFRPETVMSNLPAGSINAASGTDLLQSGSSTLDLQGTSGVGQGSSGTDLQGGADLLGGSTANLF